MKRNPGRTGFPAVARNPTKLKFVRCCSMGRLRMGGGQVFLQIARIDLPTEYRKIGSSTRETGMIH